MSVNTQVWGKISLFWTETFIIMLPGPPSPVLRSDCTQYGDHFGWPAHVLALAPMQQPFIPLRHNKTDMPPPPPPPLFPFLSTSGGEKAARRKGPSKCQVVCASVKNACRASSPLNAALVLVSVMSLDNWIGYSLTLSDSHSFFSLCQCSSSSSTGPLNFLYELMIETPGCRYAHITKERQRHPNIESRIPLY